VGVVVVVEVVMVVVVDAVVEVAGLNWYKRRDGRSHAPPQGCDVLSVYSPGAH